MGQGIEEVEMVVVMDKKKKEVRMEREDKSGGLPSHRRQMILQPTGAARK